MENTYMLALQSATTDLHNKYTELLTCAPEQVGERAQELAKMLDGVRLMAIKHQRYDCLPRLYVHYINLLSQTLGHKHIILAALTEGLASVQEACHNCDEAENLYLRALHIREQHEGIAEQELIATLGKLAFHCYYHYDHSRASELCERMAKLVSACTEPLSEQAAAAVAKVGTFASELGVKI